MTTRYVIMAQGADADRKIAGLLDQHRCRWWHWFKGAWLVLDPAGGTMQEWHKRIAALGMQTWLVQRASPGASGMVPVDSIPWFEDVWAESPGSSED